MTGAERVHTVNGDEEPELGFNRKVDRQRENKMGWDHGGDDSRDFAPSQPELAIRNESVEGRKGVYEPLASAASPRPEQSPARSGA